MISPNLLIYYSKLFHYNKFLIKKAKYYVIEPYYMEGTTPDGTVVFTGSLCTAIIAITKLKFIS